MRRPSALALAAVFTFGNAFAAGRTPDPAPADPGPDDDLVATACSSGLLVRPDGADDAKGDGGAGFRKDAAQAFPGLFSAGADSKSGDAKPGDAKPGGDAPAPTPSKTQLLRPGAQDAAGCPDQVRGFYARYGSRVSAIPAPNLDAAQIRAGADPLYDKLNAGPARAVALSALSGDDLKRKRAALGALFDGGKNLNDAFAALDRAQQALARGRSKSVLDGKLVAVPAPDPAALALRNAAPAPSAAAQAAPASPYSAAAVNADQSPLSANQRRRWALHGAVPAASDASSENRPPAASWWNRYAPVRVQDATSRAGSWVADKVWGGGSPAVNVEMPADSQQPPRWRRVRFGNYGTDAMIKGLLAVGADMGKLGAPTLLLGDISQKGGGSFRGHLSHKIGKDVDIFFITDSRGRFDPVWNLKLAATAVKDMNVTIIFVDTRMKNAMERTYASSRDLSPAERIDMSRALSKMQFWPGHDTHFHIRIDY